MPKKWTVDLAKLPSDLVNRICLQVREGKKKEKNDKTA